MVVRPRLAFFYVLPLCTDKSSPIQWAAATYLAATATEAVGRRRRVCAHGRQKMTTITVVLTKTVVRFKKYSVNPRAFVIGVPGM